MTRDQKIYRAASWLACFMIAVTFLSGFHKILYPADFSLAVYRFHLLPDVLVNIVSLYVPWVEVVCGFCLLFVPKLRVASLWIVLVLLIIFTIAIGINLFQGSEIGCGCFSSAPDAQPMSGMSLARNVALMGLAGLALFGFKRST